MGPRTKAIGFFVLWQIMGLSQIFDLAAQTATTAAPPIAKTLSRPDSKSSTSRNKCALAVLKVVSSAAATTVTPTAVSRQTDSTEAQLSRGRAKLRHFFDLENRDNERLDHLHVEIAAALTPNQRQSLIHFLQDKLGASAHQIGPLAGHARGNYDHIDIHVKAIQAIGNRAGGQGFDDLFLDRNLSSLNAQDLQEIFLIQALLHDLGKVAHHMNWISPELRAALSEVFSELGSDEDLKKPGSNRFRFETIMSHHLLSHELIDTFIREWAALQTGSSPMRDATLNSLIESFQLSIARHNAGYQDLLVYDIATQQGQSPPDRNHFWQIMWPKTAALYKKHGYNNVALEARPSRGLMQAFLALVDRGASAHATFRAKLAAEGVFGNPADPAKEANFLHQNGHSVRDQVWSIFGELQRFMPTYRSMPLPLDADHTPHFVQAFLDDATFQIREAERLRLIIESDSKRPSP